jgi:hypothetical protein|tara:strand:+ start:362 stop:556 length:195 start_codon:yes stop_codon:yes gene_type:complete
MDLFYEAQIFENGYLQATKKGCKETYIQHFLHAYRKSGDPMYAKNLALLHALSERDTSIMEINI